MGKIYQFLSSDTFSLKTYASQGLNIANYAQETWVNEVAKFSSLEPTVKEAIFRTMENLRFVQGNNRSFNPLLFDIGLIKEALTIISENNQTTIPSEFVKKSSQVLSNWIEQFDSLHSFGESTSSNFFKEDIKKFSQHLMNLKEDINALINPRGNNFVAKMLNSIKTFSDVLNTIKIMPEEARNIVNGLFGNFKSLSEKGSAVDETINKLQQTIISLKNQAIPDQEAIKAKELELKTYLSNATQEKINFDTVLDKSNTGLRLFSFFLNISGDSKLAQQVYTAGTTAVTFYKKMVYYSTMVETTGPLGAAIATADAFMSLANLFTAGSSSVEEIIQKQINELAKYSKERFDKIDRTLALMIEQIIGGFGKVQKTLIQMDKNNRAGFKLISEMVDVAYQDILWHFSMLAKEVTNDMGLLKDYASGIQKRVIKLEAYLDKFSADIHKEIRYTDLKNVASYHELFPYDEYPIGVYEVNMNYIRLLNWTAAGSKHDSLAGEYDISCSTEEICEKVESQGIEYKLNLLAGYATKFGIEGYYNARLGLANPIVWADGVRTLIKFINITPEFKFNRFLRPNFRELIDIGKQLNNFAFDIKTNKALFTSLIDDYQQKSTKLIFESYKVLIGGKYGVDAVDHLCVY